MKLNSKQKKYLRGLAHNLNPVVMVGSKGINSGVLKEVNNTLEAHELIKIRIRCENQEDLNLLVEELAEGVSASIVQTIGHSIVMFRQSVEKRITLPA